METLSLDPSTRNGKIKNQPRLKGEEYERECVDLFHLWEQQEDPRHQLQLFDHVLGIIVWDVVDQDHEWCDVWPYNPWSS